MVLLESTVEAQWTIYEERFVVAAIKFQSLQFS